MGVPQKEHLLGGPLETEVHRRGSPCGKNQDRDKNSDDVKILLRVGCGKQDVDNFT